MPSPWPGSPPSGLATAGTSFAASARAAFARFANDSSVFYPC